MIVQFYIPPLTRNPGALRWFLVSFPFSAKIDSFCLSQTFPLLHNLGGPRRASLVVRQNGQKTDFLFKAEPGSYQLILKQHWEANAGIVHKMFCTFDVFFLASKYQPLNSGLVITGVGSLALVLVL